MTPKTTAETGQNPPQNSGQDADLSPLEMLADAQGKVLHVYRLVDTPSGVQLEHCGVMEAGDFDPETFRMRFGPGNYELRLFQRGKRGCQQRIPWRVGRVQGAGGAAPAGPAESGAGLDLRWMLTEMQRANQEHNRQIADLAKAIATRPEPAAAALNPLEMLKLLQQRTPANELVEMLKLIRTVDSGGDAGDASPSGETWAQVIMGALQAFGRGMKPQQPAPRQRVPNTAPAQRPRQAAPVRSAAPAAAASENPIYEAPIDPQNPVYEPEPQTVAEPGGAAADWRMTIHRAATDLTWPLHEAAAAVIDAGGMVLRVLVSTLNDGGLRELVIAEDPAAAEYSERLALLETTIRMQVQPIADLVDQADDDDDSFGDDEPGAYGAPAGQEGGDGVRPDSEASIATDDPAEGHG